MPRHGTFTSAQNVTLSSATSGAAIRYTLDGSTPTASSPLYAGAFSVAAPGKTIKAIAIKSGMNNSGVASAVFTINQVNPVANPSFMSRHGTYTAAQTVRLSTPTAGAAIWYAVNGGAQQLYSDAAPIQVGASATLSAVAKKAA
ncbi:chitobiase/beta-hexosaminidase C-terminal domain-containing protein [Massilia sp. H-1]|nr:chitobiase/beta-hexosaminidase C-terminal domain-containing protein [Massilia sp. H-1]